jgi:hypothetical protein
MLDPCVWRAAVSGPREDATPMLRHTRFPHQTAGKWQDKGTATYVAHPVMDLRQRDSFGCFGLA